MSLPARVLRIAVIADTDVRPPELPPERVDVLVSCGDLFDDTIAWYAEWLQPRYIVGVRGNHDTIGPFAADVVDLHGRVVDIEGCVFGGFGGCLEYKAGAPHQFTEEEAERALSQFPGVDVLVTHAPPLGTHDASDDPAHRGVMAFRDYSAREQPAFHLHGHMHVQQKTVVGATRVICTYGFRSLVIAAPE